MFLAITLLSLLISPLFFGQNATVWILAIGQLAMLISVIREKHLTGGGAFIFMSFLFFGVRPIYFMVERDYLLFDTLFFVNPTKPILHQSMWWGTLAMLAFQGGRWLARNGHRLRWRQRAIEAKAEARRLNVVGIPIIALLIIYQVISLGIMFILGTAGRSLYESALGAYIYDLPAVLQAGHVFTLLLCVERMLRDRSFVATSCVVISSILFLIFTYEMRTVSMFRSFYLSGVMVGGLAVLARIKPNVNALWLIIPIALVLPGFKFLGEARYIDSSSLTSEISSSKKSDSPSIVDTYWDFYDGAGDMNIYDTFVAARMSKPTKHPYVLSWLYVPFHLVPRALWSGKPERGTLQDVSFTYGAPYCPGIAGFFYLDGGDTWMLLSMLTLGYLITFLDFSILTMPRGYLRFCLYGIVIVYGMLLSRLFLWQYFYSVLYFVIPCLLLNRMIQSMSGAPNRNKKHGRRRPRIIRASENPALSQPR